MSRRAGCASPICGSISRCRRGTPGTASTISARPSCRSAVPRTSGLGATATAFRWGPWRRWSRSWISEGNGTRATPIRTGENGPCEKPPRFSAKSGSSAISGKFPQPKEVFDMPVAKIHVHEGAFRDSELATIGTAVQAALEEVRSVPPEDYFRITHVLPKGQFVHTPAFVGCTYSERLVLLELTFISGRPKEKRLALLAALNRLVVEKVSLRPDDLLVMIYELPGENISFGHGLAQRAHISA